MTTSTNLYRLNFSMCGIYQMGFSPGSYSVILRGTELCSQVAERLGTQLFPYFEVPCIQLHSNNGKEFEFVSSLNVELLKHGDQELSWSMDGLVTGRVREQ